MPILVRGTNVFLFILCQYLEVSGNTITLFINDSKCMFSLRRIECQLMKLLCGAVTRAILPTDCRIFLLKPFQQMSCKLWQVTLANPHKRTRAVVLVDSCE